MPITYRQHQDTRDGKIYNCVLMPDGKWWSTRNLAWMGAGRDYANAPENRELYGRIYLFSELLPPPGSHVPTDAEWATLEGNIPSPKGTRLKASSPLWTTNSGSDDYGFAVLPAGWAVGGTFLQMGAEAELWTSTEYYTRGFAGSSDDTARSSKPSTWGASVRFIIDVFNEPILPTKIKGTFSGSGVKVFCTNYNTATFELPISAQTTTELTINKDFIATWGVVLGNVRILVVDGEYISDWKDWNFNA